MQWFYPLRVEPWHMVKYILFLTSLLSPHTHVLLQGIIIIIFSLYLFLFCSLGFFSHQLSCTVGLLLFTVSQSLGIKPSDTTAVPPLNLQLKLCTLLVLVEIKQQQQQQQ